MYIEALKNSSFGETYSTGVQLLFHATDCHVRGLGGERRVSTSLTLGHFFSQFFFFAQNSREYFRE